ncbi:MAG: hypothetical protein ABFD79_07915 [Phycisphaerales bacterium]
MENKKWHFDKRINKNRQLLAIKELFENGGDENRTCEKLKIKPYVWKKWLEDDNFLSEMIRQLSALQRHNNIMLAFSRSFAITKLLSLCGSEAEEEICRKACADLLKLKPLPNELQISDPQETINRLSIMRQLNRAKKTSH